MRRTLFVHLAIIAAVAAEISSVALAQAKENAGNLMPDLPTTTRAQQRQIW